jgi:hypothetical protein
LRRHIGDRFYEEGDAREAKAEEVAHLVRAGVLKVAGNKPDHGARKKAQPRPRNKAEPKLANKAE